MTSSPLRTRLCLRGTFLDVQDEDCCIQLRARSAPPCRAASTVDFFAEDHSYVQALSQKLSMLSAAQQMAKWFHDESNSGLTKERLERHAQATETPLPHATGLQLRPPTSTTVPSEPVVDRCNSISFSAVSPSPTQGALLSSPQLCMLSSKLGQSPLSSLIALSPLTLDAAVSTPTAGGNCSSDSQSGERACFMGVAPMSLLMGSSAPLSARSSSSERSSSEDCLMLMEATASTSKRCNPGSRGHPELCSRPCSYFAVGNCGNQDTCEYCHIAHPKRPARFDRRHREMLCELSLSWFGLSSPNREGGKIDSSGEGRRLLDQAARAANVDLNSLSRYTPRRSERVLVLTLKTMSVRTMLSNVMRSAAQRGLEIEKFLEELLEYLRQQSVL
eukprot:CAMPEP_0206470730 /NCGR_PEP_ID=MMETSP0324_2-20121206/31112_1 /ASSEMBLY_ACC=CAM_ASM_000836 /TAXON_ID=2866 /ORGANISM="Crypthecodinium cohnii, Strain Seligo" /LENGTH=388 /DNA_ID=CAMNT_0053944861 /DNA_START=39 /DNA_END=1206 /DNA_ORIENTATION=-